MQNLAGQVEVLVVPSDPSDDAQVSQFIAELNRKCGAGLQFRAKIVREIATTANGKQRLVEQNLRLRDEG